ncbi:MAG: hypothetical protein ACN6N2_10025 [Acinetobacter calcoaceticus]
MSSDCFVAKVGGLPLIDDQVQVSAIATVVCAVRQRLDNARQPIEAYLQPELASKCYRQASDSITEHESITMPNIEMGIVQKSCESIIKVMPSWEVYFSIPLKWKQLVQNIASSTNPIIPQHIYLGNRGIYSNRLEEYIVHELSHTWVGMIAEVAPLARQGASIHMLPSGTPNKEIRQVIYALTFATTAIRFYRTCIDKKISSLETIGRLRYLEKYALGCIGILDSSDLVLPDGRFMIESCRRLISQ